MIDHATDCRIVFGHCTCRPVQADPAAVPDRSAVDDLPRNGDIVELRDCGVCRRMQYRNRDGVWIHAYKPYNPECWAV